MSNETVPSLRDVAEAILIDAAWSQWSALTAAAVPSEGRPARTLVDPEALVLASLAVGHRERRLDDVVASWATHASHLMSLQRMRTLASRFPARPGADRRFRRPRHRHRGQAVEAHGERPHGRRIHTADQARRRAQAPRGTGVDAAAPCGVRRQCEGRPAVPPHRSCGRAGGPEGDRRRDGLHRAGAADRHGGDDFGGIHPRDRGSSFVVLRGAGGVAAGAAPDPRRPRGPGAMQPFPLAVLGGCPRLPRPRGGVGRRRRA